MDEILRKYSKGKLTISISTRDQISDGDFDIIVRKQIKTACKQMNVRWIVLSNYPLTNEEFVNFRTFLRETIANVFNGALYIVRLKIDSKKLYSLIISIARNVFANIDVSSMDYSPMSVCRLIDGGGKCFGNKDVIHDLSKYSHNVRQLGAQICLARIDRMSKVCVVGSSIMQIIHYFRIGIIPNVFEDTKETVRSILDTKEYQQLVEEDKFENMSSVFVPDKVFREQLKEIENKKTGKSKDNKTVIEPLLVDGVRKLEYMLAGAMVWCRDVGIYDIIYCGAAPLVYMNITQIQKLQRMFNIQFLDLIEVLGKVRKQMVDYKTLEIRQNMMIIDDIYDSSVDNSDLISRKLKDLVKLKENNPNVLNVFVMLKYDYKWNKNKEVPEKFKIFFQKFAKTECRLLFRLEELKISRNRQLITKINHDIATFNNLSNAKKNRVLSLQCIENRRRFTKSEVAKYDLVDAVYSLNSLNLDQRVEIVNLASAKRVTMITTWPTMPSRFTLQYGDIPSRITYEKMKEMVCYNTYILNPSTVMSMTSACDVSIKNLNDSISNVVLTNIDPVVELSLTEQSFAIFAKLPGAADVNDLKTSNIHYTRLIETQAVLQAKTELMDNGIKFLEKYSFNDENGENVVIKQGEVLDVSGHLMAIRYLNKYAGIVIDEIGWRKHNKWWGEMNMTERNIRQKELLAWESALRREGPYHSSMEIKLTLHVIDKFMKTIGLSD